jgi:hypothetical protein
MMDCYYINRARGWAGTTASTLQIISLSDIYPIYASYEVIGATKPAPPPNTVLCFGNTCYGVNTNTSRLMNDFVTDTIDKAYRQYGGEWTTAEQVFSNPMKYLSYNLVGIPATYSFTYPDNLVVCNSNNLNNNNHNICYGMNSTANLASEVRNTGGFTVNAPDLYTNYTAYIGSQKIGIPSKYIKPLPTNLAICMDIENICYSTSNTDFNNIVTN